MKNDPVITVALPYSQILELIEAARIGGVENPILNQAKNTLQRVVRPATNDQGKRA